MNASRIIRVAASTRPSAARLPRLRRGYADAVSDKIKLTLALPHQVSTTAIMTMLLIIIGFAVN